MCARSFVFIAMNEKRRARGSLLSSRREHAYISRTRLSVRRPCESAFSSRAIWENASDLPKLRHIRLTPRLGEPQHVCTERRNEKMISSCGAPSCSNGLRSRGETRIRERFAFYFFLFFLPRRIPDVSRLTFSSCSSKAHILRIYNTAMGLTNRCVRLQRSEGDLSKLTINSCKKRRTNYLCSARYIYIFHVFKNIIK